VDDGVVIFDGDDTLWETEALYDHARAEAARIVEAAGLAADEWERIERRLDVANVGRFGFARRRFPTSCVEAYQQVAWMAGVAVAAPVERAIWTAAESVFQAKAPLIPGGRHVLTLVKRLYRTVLLTQGDPDVQQRRIKDSGLAALFNVVKIVDSKEPSTFGMILADMTARPSASWMVGNSVRSDINPAIAAGMNAILVDAHVWEFERMHRLPENHGVYFADTINEVPGIIMDASPDQSGAVPGHCADNA
jgi:putative hydrolase of the HAD superfamily